MSNLSIKPCHKCQAQGYVQVMVETEGSHGRIGTGWDYAQCPLCKGTGLVREIITYESWEPKSHPYKASTKEN